VQRHFWDRRGHQGGGGARGSWWQRPIGLLEEEDSRATDRAGQARPEGGGREVGHGWARRGRKRGVPRLGRKSEMAGFKK
jgi:hypothetical protein